MASTYENDLRLEEMATGENSGSWGTKTNTNLELIADAFSYGTETIANADTTITIADGAADAARSLALKINSSADLTTTRTITLAPNTTSKVWIIENNTSGGQTLTISAGSGSNVTLLNGQTKIIATDGIGAGSNVVELTQDLAIADLFIDDDLSMQSDGAIINFGADADITLTHAADTSLTLGGAGSTTGLIVNNTATDGDPFLAFALSGTQKFTMGVDDGDSDKFKIGTTAIGTDTRLSIDSSGNVEIAGDITLTGATTISNTADNFVIDAVGDIVLDSDDGDIQFKDTGTVFMNLYESSNNAMFYNPISDGDIKFQGKDNTSVITALTLDMSEAGAATFNNAVMASGTLSAHQTNKGVLEYTSNFTKIRSYGASSGTGQIQFLTGGGGGSTDSLAMTIDTSGNVIIGAASAVGDLHVQRTDGAVLWLGRTTNSGQTTALLGEVRFGDTAFDSNLASIQSNLDGSTTSSNLSFYTQATGAAAAERMRISSAGDVELIQSNNLYWKHQGGGTIRAGITADSSDNLTFSTGSSDTTHMTLDGSGRVGIGATPDTDWRNDIPNQKVLMLGTEATLFSDAGVTTALINNALINNADTFVNISTRGASQYFQYEGAHKWYTAASASAGSNINTEMTTPKMTLDNSGRLLIGTATDSNAHANADNLIIGNVPASGVNAGITIVSGNDANGAIHFSDGTSSGSANIQGQIVYEHGSNALSIYTAAGLAMNITSAGRVGITAAPEFSTVFKSLEVGPTSLVSANNTNGRMVTNVYYDGNYKRKTDGVSLQYEQDVAGHLWYFDASGTADAAFTQTEIARLNTSGHFVLSGGGNVVLNNGSGIDFSATGEASGQTSELFDDYEEGTWTPYLARWSGGAISATYTEQTGRYTKVGRLVTVSFSVITSAISSQGTSIAYIAGLPYNNDASHNYLYAGTFGSRTAISDSTVATSIIKHSTNNSLLFRQNNDFDENVDDDWLVGTMRGSITYEHG